MRDLSSSLLVVVCYFPLPSCKFLRMVVFYHYTKTLSIRKPNKLPPQYGMSGCRWCEEDFRNGFFRRFWQHSQYLAISVRFLHTFCLRDFFGECYQLLWDPGARFSRSPKTFWSRQGVSQDINNTLQCCYFDMSSSGYCRSACKRACPS